MQSLENRRIIINNAVKLQNSNKIKTSKYTWWNCIPLFLYIQYSKVFNVFALLMAIVNSISGVVQPMSIILPFAAVMLSAVVRELIDEIVKRKHDRQ